MAFSKEGLYGQLVFEKFVADEARHAVTNVQVDWKEQAVRKGKDYLDLMPMSQDQLRDQLVFDKFTKAEADYAVNKLFN